MMYLVHMNTSFKVLSFLWCGWFLDHDNIHKVYGRKINGIFGTCINDSKNGPRL